MKISPDTFVRKFDEACVAKDKVKTLALVMELKRMINEEPEMVKWFVEPKNLTHLHVMLTTYLEVPEQAMAVKMRVQNRQQRARLFVEAIEKGVRRVV